MARKGANVTLSSYDEIFTTEESRTESQQEHVQMIPLSELHPFEGHPFRVVDDEEMQKTVESVKQYGVLTPAIARPDPDGGYEIISGHRRLRASELAGLETLPVIVREMDDDTAIIFMVDSNLQREHILPSERAFAYRMKLEAMKHQAGRPSKEVKENYSQVGNNSGRTSSEEMAEELGTSKNQIFRYIRLTELIPEIRDMVDEKKIAFNPAVELSYLKPEEQREFLEAMDYAQAAPSLSQAEVFPEILYTSADAGRDCEAAGPVAEKEKQRTGTIRRICDMCYRNGYGYRCDCCGEDFRQKNLSSNEAVLNEIMRFMKVWNDMIEAVKYDENGMEPFMVAFTPGEQMKVIPKDKAEEYLPCFGEDDVIELAPDTDFVISYDRQLLFKVGDQKYLDGPALIYAVDEEGEVLSLSVADIYEIQEMLERRTLLVTEDGDEMPVLSLN